jgi:hypothetical protein
MLRPTTMSDSETPLRRWLARARVTDDAAGDLIADMRRDRQLPRVFDSLADMRHYLEARAAVPALWRRWRRWRRWRDRHGA